MVEKIASKIILKILGKFLENYDQSKIQVSVYFIQLWSGKLSL